MQADDTAAQRADHDQGATAAAQQRAAAKQQAEQDAADAAAEDQAEQDAADAAAARQKAIEDAAAAAKQAADEKAAADAAAAEAAAEAQLAAALQTHGLTLDEFETKMDAMFTQFDTDGSGSLAVSELPAVAETMASLRGWPVSNAGAAAKEMLSGVEVGSDGTMSKAQFKSLMRSTVIAAQQEAAEDKAAEADVELQAALKTVFGEGCGVEQFTGAITEQFMEFDTDGSGALSMGELFLVHKAIAGQLGNADMSEIQAAFDKDGDGTVTLQEFKVFMRMSMISCAETLREAE